MSLCVVSNLGCLPTPTHNKCSVYTQKYFLILYPGEPFLDRHVFNTGLISRLFFPTVDYLIINHCLCMCVVAYDDNVVSRS